MTTPEYYELEIKKLKRNISILQERIKSRDKFIKDLYEEYTKTGKQ